MKSLFHYLSSRTPKWKAMNDPQARRSTHAEPLFLFVSENDPTISLDFVIQVDGTLYFSITRSATTSILNRPPAPATLSKIHSRHRYNVFFQKSKQSVEKEVSFLFHEDSYGLITEDYLYILFPNKSFLTSIMKHQTITSTFLPSTETKPQRVNLDYEKLSEELSYYAKVDQALFLSQKETVFGMENYSHLLQLTILPLIREL